MEDVGVITGIMAAGTTTGTVAGVAVIIGMAAAHGITGGGTTAEDAAVTVTETGIGTATGIATETETATETVAAIVTATAAETVKTTKTMEITTTAATTT